MINAADLNNYVANLDQSDTNAASNNGSNNTSPSNVDVNKLNAYVSQMDNPTQNAVGAVNPSYIPQGGGDPSIWQRMKNWGNAPAPSWLQTASNMFTTPANLDSGINAGSNNTANAIVGFFTGKTPAPVNLGAMGGDPNSIAYKTGNIIGSGIPYAASAGPIGGVANIAGDTIGGLSGYLANLGSRVAGNAAISYAGAPQGTRVIPAVIGGVLPMGEDALQWTANTDIPTLANNIVNKLGVKADAGLQQMQDAAKATVYGPNSTVPTQPIEPNDVLSPLTDGQSPKVALANNDAAISNIIKTNGNAAKTESNNQYNAIFNEAQNRGVTGNIPMPQFKNAVSNINDPSVLSSGIQQLISKLSNGQVNPATGFIEGGLSLNDAHDLQSSLGADARNLRSSAIGSDRQVAATIENARQAARGDILNQLGSVGLGQSYQDATQFYKNKVLPYQTLFPKIMNGSETNMPNIVNKFKNPTATVGEDGIDQSFNPQSSTGTPSRSDSLAQILNDGGDNLVNKILLDRVSGGVKNLSGVDGPAVVNAVNSSSNFNGFEPYLNSPQGLRLQNDAQQLAKANLVTKAGIDNMSAKELIPYQPVGQPITPEMGAAVTRDYLGNSLKNANKNPSQIETNFNSMFDNGHDKYAQASGLAPLMSTLNKRLGFQDLASRLITGAAGFGAGHLFGPGMAPYIEGGGAIAGFSKGNLASNLLNRAGRFIPSAPVRGAASAIAKGALSTYMNNQGNQ